MEDSRGNSRSSPVFPTTHWSRLLSPTGEREGERAAREALARRYWRPVVAYVRARWRVSEEDARDAAQDFFLWIFEGDFLARADPARGRFRGFVKTSLARFLTDMERRRRTLKRGGHRAFLPVGTDDGELDLPDAAGRRPEAVLDDLWRQELLSQAAEALERELVARGKERAFRVFQDFYLAEEDVGYEALAGRYGISPTGVSNALAYARQRYRTHLRAAVRETVRDDEDLRAELAWLLERDEGD